jgi:hypothetical protein
MTFRHCAALFFLLLFIPSFSYAQEKSKSPVDVWVEAENAMIAPLNDDQKESVFILRNKHSIIRVIGVVERDIGNAVKACVEKNPDLKDRMETRFNQWKGAVLPIVETARKNLDKDIKAQSIVKPEEFKKVMKLNDKAFEYSDEQTIKTPVSEKSACEDLLSSMDDTEDRMITLLRETLLTESVIRERVEQLKKQEPAPEAKETETKNFSKDQKPE